MSEREVLFLSKNRRPPSPTPSPLTLLLLAAASRTPTYRHARAARARTDRLAAPPRQRSPHTHDAHTHDAHTHDAHTHDAHTHDAHTSRAHTHDAHSRAHSRRSDDDAAAPTTTNDTASTTKDSGSEHSGSEHNGSGAHARQRTLAGHRRPPPTAAGRTLLLAWCVDSVTSAYTRTYERERRALLAAGLRCELRLACNGATADSADHDPPLAWHRHEAGSGCCRLVAACLACQHRQGGLVAARGASGAEACAGTFTGLVGRQPAG